MQTQTNSSAVPMASATPAVRSMREEMQRCIQNCLECSNICDQTMAVCLQMGGKHAEASHILLLRDCAESCAMSASMMARGSSFSKQHCQMCADICRACAEECESMGGNDQMEVCADACRRCEESCRNM